MFLITLRFKNLAATMHNSLMNPHEIWENSRGENFASVNGNSTE